MSDELFHTEPTLSPRQKWIRDHKVGLACIPDHADPARTWQAAAHGIRVEGESKDDVLARLANRLATEKGINPWNA